MKPQWIFLSYELSPGLTSYGGKSSLVKTVEKQMSCGDNCNTSSLHLSVHSGTHIDYPFHFSDSGKNGSVYKAQDWIFTKIQVFTLSKNPENDKIYTVNDLKSLKLNNDTEIIFFDTGFHKIRNEDAYWSHNPGFDHEVAMYLKECCPSLKAIGMDSISMNPWMNKEKGRMAHKSFLIESDLLIIEDVNFSHLPSQALLDFLIVAPLRIESVDGAPVTIIGRIKS